MEDAREYPSATPEYGSRRLPRSFRTGDHKGRPYARTGDEGTVAASKLSSTVKER